MVAINQFSKFVAIKIFVKSNLSLACGYSRSGKRNYILALIALDPFNDAF